MSLRYKLLKKILKNKISRLKEASIQTWRDDFFEKTGDLHPMPKNIQLEAVKIDHIPASWIYDQTKSPKRVILWFHGGSFFAGSINYYKNFMALYASLCDAKILLIDYRLSPENRFPSAHEDCLKAYQWLLSEGYEPGSIIIAGDDVGAGLAISTLLKCKREQLPQPKAVVLISGFYNYRDFDILSDLTEVKDFIFDSSVIDHMKKYYENLQELSDPILSPALGDLSDLPPIFLMTGNEDISLHQSIEFAKNAKRHGSEVELKIGNKMIHNYPFFPDYIPEARAARKQIASWIEEKVPV